MQVLAGTERLTRTYLNHPRDADGGLSRRGLLAQIRAGTDFAPTRPEAARWQLITLHLEAQSSPGKTSSRAYR